MALHHYSTNIIDKPYRTAPETSVFKGVRERIVCYVCFASGQDKVGGADEYIQNKYCPHLYFSEKVFTHCQTFYIFGNSTPQRITSVPTRSKCF